MTQSAGELISAGYLITKAVARPQYASSELVPPTVLSASSCIAPFLPDAWALEWTEEDAAHRQAQAAAFGVPPERLAAVVAYATRSFDRQWRWPNVFPCLQAAREFCAEVLPPESGALIIGLALSKVDQQDFLRQAADLGLDDTGIVHHLGAGELPEAGGRQLGSDVLALEDGGSFHSFLCNGLERAFLDRFGAALNEFGLYTDHELARRCAHAADEGAIPAEPCPWRAWVLTQYAVR